MSGAQAGKAAKEFSLTVAGALIAGVVVVGLMFTMALAGATVIDGIVALYDLLFG